MRILNIRQMRSALGDLDRLLSEAGEIVLVRRGTPIARITPTETIERPSRQALRREILAHTKGALSVSDEVRADRDAR